MSIGKKKTRDEIKGLYFKGPNSKSYKLSMTRRAIPSFPTSWSVDTASSQSVLVLDPATEKNIIPSLFLSHSIVYFSNTEEILKWIKCWSLEGTGMRTGRRWAKGFRPFELLNHSGLSQLIYPFLYNEYKQRKEGQKYEHLVWSFRVDTQVFFLHMYIVL